MNLKLKKRDLLKGTALASFLSGKALASVGHQTVNIGLFGPKADHDALMKVLVPVWNKHMAVDPASYLKRLGLTHLSNKADFRKVSTQEYSQLRVVNVDGFILSYVDVARLILTLSKKS